MKQNLVVFISVFLILAASILPAQAAGRIVLANDEWTLSNASFSSSGTQPDKFALNVANWFSGSTGNFLVLSDNFGLTESSLQTVMTNAGYGWTIGPVNPNPSLSYLQSFDAVFLARNPVDNNTLIDYVNGGGNVYLAGGAGWLNEAEAWNPFLNAFGLAFAPDYNNIVGNITINSSHPIFTNVSSLYQGGGSDIFDITPSDLNSQVLVTFDGHGLYAVYDSSSPEPVTIDIKPGDASNTINTRSKTVTVAILSSASFYAPDDVIVDRLSLTFGPTGDEQSLLSCATRKPKDVNGDTLKDLVCTFSIKDAGFKPDDQVGILKGRTDTETAFEGIDDVSITTPRK